MAQIQLIVNAETPDEYHSILAGLARPTRTVSAPTAAPTPDSSVSATNAQTDSQELTDFTRSQPSEPSADGSKRTRRTKAQIEADNAAAAQPGTAASLDPFAEQVKESAKEPAPASGAVTRDDVRAAMSRFLALPGKSAQQLGALMTEVAGVPNLGAMDPARYETALGALKQAGA